MIKQETDPFKRAFIRVWYNDWFRILFIIAPGHWIVTLPISIWLDVHDDWLMFFAIFSYLVIMGFGIEFNDYTNLYRIGRDIKGKKQ